MGWAKRHVKVGDLVRIGHHAPKGVVRFDLGLVYNLYVRGWLLDEWIAEVLLPNCDKVCVYKRYLEPHVARSRE